MARKEKRARGISLASIINATILIALGIVMLYPFWYVLVFSLSTYKDAISHTFLFWPVNFTLQNIRYILNSGNFAQIYGNTLFVVGVGTALSLAVTMLFAYALARDVPGKSWISHLLFFTILFSGGMIPTYLVVRSTGLLNTLWALIIPRLMDPFYVFLMKNFFQAIPKELDEAAIIDGAGLFTLMVRIVLPLSLAGIATIGLYYGVGYWNQFFDAIIYINKREKWVLQVLLRELLTHDTTDILGSSAGIASSFDANAVTTYSIKMACVVTAVVPVTLIYPFVQRYFVKGVIVGAVKG